MDHKLFLVCPFSCMEHFLRQKYGANSFFMTATGGVFQLDENEILAELKYFIRRQKINEIFIVSDISCRFINNAINGGLTNGYYSEIVIQKLLEDNYNFVIENKTIQDQQIKLAELIVKRQSSELKKANCLQQEIVQNKILIRELVTSKNSDQILQLKTKQ